MCIASFIIPGAPCLCISIMKCSDKQADLIYALNILRTFEAAQLIWIPEISSGLDVVVSRGVDCDPAAFSLLDELFLERHPCPPVHGGQAQHAPTLQLHAW